MPADQLRDTLHASFAGRYEIERELGGGGMSRVFVADEVRFHRKVVIKVLAPELAAGLSAERFEREIALAAALQEPHIVPLLTAGDVEGLPWYAMPYVEGESLRARLMRGPMPLGDATKILADIAHALSYAHARGIAHRDIKPENVLLSSGTAVVTDFGIAKALSSSRTETSDGTLTAIGTCIGTPAYMSPEQASGDPATDHRADLYAWGVMAYELLAGRHPFASKTAPQQLLAAHIAETPASLLGVLPTGRAIPRSLATLVMRCLEKDPEARPSSAAAILAALEEPLSRRSAPSPKAVLAACAIVLAIGTGLFVWRARTAPPVADDRLVAVLPFRVAGADAALAYLREGMVDLLAAKMTGSTRVADARSVLAAWRAAGGNVTSDVDRAAAIRIARGVDYRHTVLAIGLVTVRLFEDHPISAAAQPTSASCRGPGRAIVPNR